MYPGWEIKTGAFHLSDKEFEQFCAENKDMRIERDAFRNIWLMSPTYSSTGKFNSIILAELYIWNKASRNGNVFDSSSGFFLPNSAMRSPDVAWISNETWDNLRPEDKEGFARVCPEFIVELKSKTDDISELRKKMNEWIDNGCQLAWLINLDKKEVEIYRPGKKLEVHSGFEGTLSGESLLPGFEFDLSLLV